MASDRFSGLTPHGSPSTRPQQLHMKYGSGYVSVSVPQRNLAGTLEPREAAGVADDRQAIESALGSPIGAPPIGDLVGGKRKIAIVVSDVTRPAPTSKMLPPLLDTLNHAGVRDSDVTVVFALGIHRPHTAEERRKLVGPAVFDRVRCVDPAPGEHTFLGTTSRGTPVEAARIVVEADFRICTGNVEYHYFAGYSGGAKALVPGVCTRATVEHNHSMMLMPEAAASRIDDNPVRQDIEEAASKIGVDYVLNTVLNGRREIVRVVAGDQRASLRDAARTVDEMYLAPLDQGADIVVASAGGYPKDINLYQAQKAIDNARFAVRPGGYLLLIAECAEGLGEDTFAEWMEAAATPEDLTDRIKRQFVLGGHKAAAIAMAMRTARIGLASSFTDEFARGLFFEPVTSPQEGLDRALAEYGPDARVLVMPNAGSTLPRPSAS